MNPPSAGPQPALSPKLMRPVPRKRVERFQWQVPDTLWIIAAAVVSAALIPHDPRHFRSILGGLIDILCASFAYVAGLRLHGRIAGVATALLIATSVVFANLCVDHPVSGAAACAAIVAVASYGAGWMLPAFGAACIAFTLGFNGALIGASICIVALLQRRDFALAGAASFTGFGLLWSLAVSPLHLPNSLRPLSSWHEAYSLIAGVLFALWFAAPFWAEATARAARANWALTLTLMAVFIIAAFASTGSVTAQLYDAFPLVMLMIAVGLGRLMPAIAGDYTVPWVRYAAAATVVAMTLVTRYWLDPRPPYPFQDAPTAIQASKLQTVHFEARNHR